MFVTTIDGLLISVDDAFGLNGLAVGVYCWAVLADTFQRKELKEIVGKNKTKERPLEATKATRLKVIQTH